MPQWLFFPIFLWTRGAFFGFGGLSFFPLSAQLHGGWRGGSKYGNAIGRDSAPVALLAYVWFFFPSGGQACFLSRFCRVAWLSSVVGDWSVGFFMYDPCTTMRESYFYT